MLRSLLCFPPPRVARARATSPSGLSRKRERPGWRPVSQYIGAVSAEQESLPRSVRRPGTESKPLTGVCALLLRRNATANVCVTDAGDGLQPHLTLHPGPSRAPDRGLAMSHAAIAAVLALEDLAVGERLAAFSLASFANREQRAWPGTRLAAARAGLSRSQYLVSREGLVGRRLVVVEGSGRGRGQSPSLSLRFASAGPWFEADVNAELVESVLSHSRTRGSARAPRWPRSLTRADRCRRCRPRRSAMRRGWPTAPTVARGRRCCPPTSCCSRRPAVGGRTRTAGSSATPDP